MVERLVSARGIVDKEVLNAMRTIPRHVFVDQALADRAYDDYAAPIGDGQTLSQPYMVGLLLQTAKIGRSDTVLEVGTGSGYTTALLGALAERVYTIERINSLSNRARKIFNRFYYKNIVCIVGDGSMGSARYAPFDAIVVTAGAPRIPMPLARQLGEGGRMVIPVGEEKNQTLNLVIRKGNRFAVTRIEPCSFVPLVGKHGYETKQVKY